MTTGEVEGIIAALGLAPHPEGGHYRETWKAEAAPGARAAGTAIYYLLRAGERSALHRIDSAEIWHFYAGAPLELAIGPDPEGPLVARTLGPDVAGGARPQLVVPPAYWQTAQSTGDYTLAGCTVSPGFTFDTFEMYRS